MIDWIHEGCKHWGFQMRVTYLGKDGWPPRTILDKMIKEGVLGASAGKFMQFFPECLDAEALRYNNAIKGLDEDMRNRLFIHYVVIGKGKVKAARMEEARTVYYDRLNAAHNKLAFRLSARFAQDEDRKKKLSDPDKMMPKCPGVILETAA